MNKFVHVQDIVNIPRSEQSGKSNIYIRENKETSVEASFDYRSHYDVDADGQRLGSRSTVRSG